MNDFRSRWESNLGWAVVFAGSLDNLIKPWFVNQGSHMPSILIFFDVAAGGLAFGFIGVLLGHGMLASGSRLFKEWNSSVGTSPGSGSEADSESLVHAP